MATGFDSLDYEPIRLAKPIIISDASDNVADRELRYLSGQLIPVGYQRAGIVVNIVLPSLKRLKLSR